MRRENDLVKIFPQYLTGEDLFGLSDPTVLKIIESVSEDFFCASLMVCNSWKNSRPCLCYGLSGLETVLGCMLEAQLLCNFVLNFLFICV